MINILLEEIDKMISKISVEVKRFIKDYVLLSLFMQHFQSLTRFDPQKTEVMYCLMEICLFTCFSKLLVFSNSTFPHHLFSKD